MSDPRGHRRYVKNNRRLAAKLPPVCSWCGKAVDMDLPRNHPMSWTTDHTIALVDGGDLYGDRTLMHRRCNSLKDVARREGQPAPIKTTRAW